MFDTAIDLIKKHSMQGVSYSPSNHIVLSPYDICDLQKKRPAFDIAHVCNFGAICKIAGCVK